MSKDKYISTKIELEKPANAAIGEVTFAASGKDIFITNSKVKPIASGTKNTAALISGDSQELCREALKEIKCFCLDMDGTIYLSGVLFDGAAKAIKAMQSRGRVMFLTNNSSRTREEYFEKLTALGLDIERGDIYTSTVATIDFLNENHKGKSTLVIATEAVKREFREGGVILSESENAEVAVLAYDTTLTYGKLDLLCRIVNNGAFFVATHPDLTCPTSTGYAPDVGAMLKLVRAVTGKSPNVICGKPRREYGREIMRQAELKPYQIAMVGDRLKTDMQLSYNCGFKSVLVLSGETKMSDIEDFKAKKKRIPDIILKSIADITECLE